MIHIGFTGTQVGMTAAQYGALEVAIGNLKQDFIAHHGDCIGADAQFNRAAWWHPKCRGIILHLPNIDAKRAFCDLHPFGASRTPKPYLERNRDIVKESDVLIVTPKEPHMQLRSGTWSTYRYAVELRKPRYLILPNGATVYEAE